MKKGARGYRGGGRRGAYEFSCKVYVYLLVTRLCDSEGVIARGGDARGVIARG